jgi:Polyketide cyclase / dehydrase and lipid transport
MWSQKSTQVYRDVSGEAIWKLWVDVNDWKSWHGDLDRIELRGEFAVGNSFLLKPKGAPAFKIAITEIVPGRKFTDCTSFPGAKMFDTHELEEVPGGVRLTSTLSVTGPLGFLWRKLVAENVARTVSVENDALVALARARSSPQELG